jgi:twitching motility protein PilT
MLDHINHTKRRHIITLENPIEFVHVHDKCMINQREVGDDTDSFASGLRAALRQDPDVILVGEMRDLETISTAITAAETGHLVFGTLHTKGAANTIDRIIDVFPPEQQEQIRIQLADVLEAAIAKALLPKIGGGRVPAYEVLVATPAVRSLIRQNKSFQIPSVMQTSKRQGMQMLDEALAALVRKGAVRPEDAMAVANDPAALKSQLGRL